MAVVSILLLHVSKRSLSVPFFGQMLRLQLIKHGNILAFKNLNTIRMQPSECSAVCFVSFDFQSVCPSVWY